MSPFGIPCRCTRWLKAHLFYRCKTPSTGRDWLRGRGGWERDDRLYNGQADARASDDAGRSASYSEHETRGGHRADPAGTSVGTRSIAAPRQLVVTIGWIRATNTCLRQTRHRKCRQPVRQVGGTRRYLGIHITCSQRWCGHGSGSRQNWR